MSKAAQTPIEDEMAMAAATRSHGLGTGLLPAAAARMRDEVGTRPGLPLAQQRPGLPKFVQTCLATRTGGDVFVAGGVVQQPK